MRIATLTCYNYLNQGASLQAYALTRWLASQGHDVAMIDYMPDYQRFSTTRWYMPASLKEAVSLFVHYPRRSRRVAMHSRHVDFARRHLPLTRAYSGVADIQADPPQADAYIVGSDQVWNPAFHSFSDPAFFLRFGSPAARRISYAASFAVPQVDPVKLSGVAGWLGGLDAVSVRETSGLGILAQAGCGGTRVCDPVFLHDPAFWRAFMDNSVVPARPYLLVYDFYGDPGVKALAKRLARRRGLEIWSVSPLRLPYASRNCYDCTPQAFVALLAGAGCVVSNSFHATAFSFVFERDFFVVGRPDGLNDRMRDITALYGLDSRLVAPDCPDSALDTPIDWQRVTPLVQADREASRRWLADALANNTE